MVISFSIIIISWVVFVSFWLISAASSKKTLPNNNWKWGIVFRVVVIAVAIILVHEQLISRSFFFRQHNPLFAAIGAVLCALGIAFAIWARVYLGRNWGMPMTVKAEREIVTSGPYRFVRHPIYTGMLFASFGSMLALGVSWLIFFVIIGAYFIYSAVAEEKMLTREFPNEYPAYKKRSKMLIPFIF